MSGRDGRGRTGRRVLAAAMLGVAAVLGPRADPQAHWSTTPIEHVQTAAVAHVELSAIGAAGARPPVRRRRPFRWRSLFARGGRSA